MTVKNAYDYLVSVLAPMAIVNRDHQYIVDFMDSLVAENNINTLRLLTCLAIDVKSSVTKLKTSSIASNQVIKAVTQCILDTALFTLPLKSPPSGVSGLHNLIKFSAVQRQISPQLFSPCVKCHTDHRYSRISSFRSYMLYLVNINRDATLNPDLTEDIDENELDRYHKEFIKKKKYQNINIFNLGRKDTWVFIADKDEVKDVGYENTKDILDRLGFYTGAIEPGSHYVCIEYDEHFAEHTYQPNAMTGDWGSLSAKADFNGNDFFLSYYINDDWGRTHSVTGGKHYFKERVHQSFNHNGTKSYAMKARNVSQLVVNLVPSTDDTIINEALDRFSKS